MNNLKLFLLSWLLSVSTLSFINICDEDLSGKWVWESPNGTRQFTIKLKMTFKDSLNGQYCAVAYSGQKLDCDFNEVINIRGNKLNGIWKVKFNSFFGAKGGLAELRKLNDSTIQWKIIKWPMGGDCFAPPNVILSKELDK